MSIYVTIDTNVLVSALIKVNSYPAKVLQYALQGDVVPLVDYDILYEYLDVLTRDKFSFNKSLVSKIFNAIVSRACFVDRKNTDLSFVDESDKVFYEVTLTSRQNSKSSYLATGNLKHYPIEPFIVSPKEFCEIMY